MSRAQSVVFSRTRVALAACCAALSGCVHFTIRNPTAGQTFTVAAAPASVAVLIEYGQDISGFNATLDGGNVTPSFNVDNNVHKATATLMVMPGTHTLAATATQKCSYCSGGTTNSSGSVSFTVSVTMPVASVTLTLPTNTVLIQRTGSAMVPVSISRANFTGAVTVTTGTLPSGVTQSPPSPLTIAATGTTATMTLNASATAPLSSAPVNVSITAAGPGATPTASKNLSIRVMPQPGAFTQVNPNARTAGATATSANGTFNLLVQTGAQAAIPQPFGVWFRQGGTNLNGGAIGFHVDGTVPLGGAGFCPGSTVGVVLTYNPQNSGLGLASQYGALFIDLVGAQHVQHGYLELYRTKQTGTYAFTPQIWMSPDCSIAMLVGSNYIGPSDNVIDFYDTLTGSHVGQTVQFNGTSFGASINGSNQIILTLAGVPQPPITIP